MNFYSDEIVVPAKFESGEFVFRPLKASDVELDYDAVVSSNSMLRAWSQSDWPKDGFQLEENLEDLKRHESEHIENIAFTFTIMDAKETQCLGCIYIKPLSEELIEFGACNASEKSREGFSASLRFWVRESHSSTDLHFDVLKAIDHWLEREWYFCCLAFPITKGDFIQSSLFEKLGYELIGDFCYKPRETYWTVYQKVIEGRSE
jgi:RimJ/RimL family protein N-acetyltransferase